MRAAWTLVLVALLAGCAPVRAADGCPPPAFDVALPVPSALPVAVEPGGACRGPPAPVQAAPQCLGADLGPGGPGAELCSPDLAEASCPQDPPRHLHASSEPEGILLTWQPPLGGPPQRYRVYRVLTERDGGLGDRLSNVPVAELPGTATSYLDHDAGDGATYWMTSVGACEGRASYAASAKRGGGGLPTVSDCVYPDVTLVPPSMASLYVGFDCMGVSNPPPFPIVLGGGG